MLCGVDLANGSHVLGAERGYRKADLSTRVSTEASATMVWGTIRDIEPLPLLWNAFPFHPFDAGNPLTNRMPTPAELAIGAPFVARLIRLFGIERVAAIGNQASLSLTRLGIAHEKVRHPSQGGKNLVRRRNGAPLAISARGGFHAAQEPDSGDQRRRFDAHENVLGQTAARRPESAAADEERRAVVDRAELREGKVQRRTRFASDLERSEISRTRADGATKRSER